MSNFKIDTVEEGVPEEKRVHLYFQSQSYWLAGNWQWNLHSQTIYCSDVMLTLPAHFVGTKGIFHPDDTAALAQSLIEAETQDSANFCFRMITSYGTVVELKGNAITAIETEPFIDGLAENAWAEQETQKQYEQENKKLRQSMALWSVAEKWAKMGTWHFNTVTYDTHYSDNLFRMHGLMPESLNAHLKTFHSFLHPEDAASFTEAFERAYQNRAPLHLTYRIIDTIGNLKHLQLITSWDFNDRGELVLGGTVIDLTEQIKAEKEWETAISTVTYLKEQIQFSEQMTDIGTWQINLFTRKSLFSDNFFRIYGLKPQLISLSLDLLANFAHPEDRPLVTEVNRQILLEHVCPEIEFRIIRNDGKVRHVQLRGKPIIRSKTDLLMVGTIKDITATRLLEKKEVKLNEELAVQTLVQQEVEVIGSTCVWLTDMQTGKMTWSPNFYTLLGYKPNLIELNQKLFTNFIHLDDKKKFTETLSLALHEKTTHDVHFRLVVKGAVKYIKATFKQIEPQGKNLFAALLQDVSQQTLLQQEQQHQQQLLAGLQNTITEKVFVTDRNNTITDLNDACHANLMPKEQTVLQKNLFDIFPQLQDADYITHLNGAFSGKTTSLSASAILKNAGPGSYLMLPLADVDNTVNNVLHVIQDSTNSYVLQHKASLHIRLVENIIELMPGRVIVMDRHMNYVYWNRKCEEHYGIKKEAVIGKNILEFSPGFYDDPHYNEFKKTLSGEVVSLTAQLNSGNEPHLEGLLYPVKDNDNKIEYILWLVFDRTDASVLVS